MHIKKSLASMIIRMSIFNKIMILMHTMTCNLGVKIEIKRIATIIMLKNLHQIVFQSRDYPEVGVYNRLNKVKVIYQ